MSKTIPSEALQTCGESLLSLLSDYCPQSTNAGEPEPVQAGHPIHQAVVLFQKHFPDGKLPGEGLTAWLGLCRTSREKDPEAFEYAARLAIWVRGLLHDCDPSTLDPTDQIILEAIPFVYTTGMAISKAVGPRPSFDTIRGRLRPESPLCRRGFVEKNPTGQGYRRKM